MKTARKDYESPATEFFVVKIEKRFCQSQYGVQQNGTRRSTVIYDLFDEDYGYDSSN